MASQPLPSPTHLKTKSLSLARSPSIHTTATAPSSSEESHDHDSDPGNEEYNEARGLVEEMDVMDGPEHEGFDRPDRREMTLILGSTAMVVLVAVAAGLTTIYDWIL
jgi:hypothetical protein